MRPIELTKENLKTFALSRGLDLFGVANIERFKEAPKSMHPSSIFPEARSVIVVGRRCVRGGWRGIEEGTYWPSYTHFNYHGLLNSFFIPLPLYETASFIEDFGYEAVPYYPGAPGIEGHGVQLSIRLAGVAAGVGEMGWSKIFMTSKFGPRQRLAAIITDLELQPDPLIEPNSICNLCMACVKGCPGAIPHIKEKRVVEVHIEDKTYRWADVDMGKCTLAYHGGDPRMSPFLPKAFPGLDFDVEKQDVSEEAAYRYCWPVSLGTMWLTTPEFPDRYCVPGHGYLQKWGGAGSFGVGGSKGCMRSCFNQLEKENRVEQVFKGGPFIKRPRWMLDTRGNPTTENCPETSE